LLIDRLQRERETLGAQDRRLPLTLGREDRSLLRALGVQDR